MADELSKPKLVLITKLSSSVKKLPAFKKDGVAKSGNTEYHSFIYSTCSPGTRLYLIVRGAQKQQSK